MALIRLQDEGLIMFTLKVFRGDRVVQELDLDGPEVKIGRSPDNPVVLADDGKGVSRVHAIIREENGQHVLYDSDSRNGTHVDGKPIKRMVIHPGQDFVVGPYRLRFGSAELSGSMPTVVVARDAAPPIERPQEGTAGGRARDTATSGVGAQAAQTKGKATEGSTKGRTVGGSTKVPAPAGPPKQGLPMAYVAGAIVGVVALGAVALFLFWPQAEPEIVTEAPPVTITTTVPEVTTTIPEPPPDPFVEQMAQATLAMEAAEDAFAKKRFQTAEREFTRILEEQLNPILAQDAAYAPALELAGRAKARADEARAARPVVPTPAKEATPVPGPGDLPLRAGESSADWKRRNDEARTDYELGKRYFNEGNHLSALKIFNDLNAREPGWLDVSAYVKNSQERLDRERLEAMNDALRLEGAGHKAYLAKNFEAAANELAAARKAFDRAAALEAPGVEKHLADNLERRRAVGRLSLDLARTHANRKNRPEARKWYQLVIDLLPSGDPIRASAEKELPLVGA